MPNQIELKGVEILKSRLIKSGRNFLRSDIKTFDLKVDNIYAEVKCKGKPYDKLDFLSFTDKQYNKIKNGKFIVFLVCNVNDPNNVEVYEFESSQLAKMWPKKYTSHEYNKTVIDRIQKKLIKG